MPAAGLGLVVVALAGGSLLLGAGHPWRATPAALSSMASADLGPVSHDPGHPASDGLPRVRAAVCAARWCSLAYNADDRPGLQTRGQLEMQAEQLVAAAFRDPRLGGVRLTVWGPSGAGQGRLFEVDCTRDDVRGLDLPRAPASRLRSSCGYVAYARAPGQAFSATQGLRTLGA